MGDLTTVDRLMEFLQLNTGTTSIPTPTILPRLVSAASAFIESNLNRIFALTDYVEVRSGKGERFITFSDYPVNSVTSLTIDGQSIPAAASFGDYGYTFDETRLALNGGRFNRGMLNIQIAYNAGYATVPLEVGQACIEVAARKYKERDRIGVNSKIINGETIVFSRSDMTDELKSILRAYQKVVPV